MASETYPSNPLDNPVHRAFHDQFINLINNRKLAECEQVLTSDQGKLEASETQAITDYYWGILYNERNRWDLSEQRLISLLCQELHPDLKAKVLNVLAIAQEHLGRLDEAIATYDCALRLIDLEYAPIYWAKVAKNRAICTIRAYEAGTIHLNQLIAARQDIEKTIKIFQASSNDRIEEGRSWNELGASYKATQDWDQAILCYEKDLAICKAENDQHGMAASLNNLGEALVGKQHFAEAELLLTQAVELFTQLNDLYEQADALTNLGHALAGRKKMTSASESFQQAIKCIESVRNHIQVDEARIDFFATQTHVYGASVEHSLQSGEIELAFDYTERARARGLLELIGNAPVYPPYGLPEELLTQEQNIRFELQQSFQEKSKILLALEQALSNLHHQIEQISPTFASFKYVSPLVTKQIFNRLPADTALISYFATKSDFIGFCLLPTHNIHAVRIRISASELSNSSFDRLGQIRSVVPVSNLLPTPWLLEHLYSKFIQPVIQYCRDYRRLAIIPHGPLHLLPLHAAYDKESKKYLVEMFELVYAPSASIIAEYLQTRHADLTRTGCLAVAYQSDDLSQPVYEAQTIARQTSGHCLIGQEATAQATLAAARTHRFLHISSHGRFNAAAPLMSGVVLADGLLTAWDLLQTSDLGLELVSLSACDTGLNLVRPGDELLGLLRALLYTGSSSVLFSLWKIEDLSARIFMELLYEEVMLQNHATHIRFSAVLSSTIKRFRLFTIKDVRQRLERDDLSSEQIDKLLSHLPYSSKSIAATSLPSFSRLFDHPYFWAPFVLVGEQWITHVAG